MKTLLLALVATLTLASAAEAQWDRNVYELLRDNLGTNVSPFGEKGVYSLETAFNYQSTWGLTSRHDIQTTTGTGSLDLENGFISLETGTTAGSTAGDQTVEYGRYEAGRAAEFGVGFFPITLPTGDGVVTWGAYTDSNGFYWRIKDNDGDGNLELCVIYERRATETEVCGIEKENGTVKPDEDESFNGDPIPPGFDPFTEGAIYVGRINWYGAGGGEAFAYAPDAGARGTLRRWLIHRHAPVSGQAFEDPNLPIQIEVDNGTTAENVEAQLGGRRFDIAGATDPEVRLSGDRRIGQGVGTSGLTPTVCVRRKAVWPPGSGRINTVAVFVESVDVLTDEQLAIFVGNVDSTSGGTWSDARFHDSAETAVEFNFGVTSVNTRETMSGPFPVAAGGNVNKQNLGARAGLRIQARETDPLCAFAISDGAAATVDTYLNVTERW